MVIPVLVIILCSLSIYYIYYYKQNEYYKNIIEKSMISEIENFENLENSQNYSLIQNAMNNPAFTRLLANGDWTTDKSNIIVEKNNKSRVSNLMKINIDEEGGGLINLSMSREKYKITSLLNMTISGQIYNKSNKSIIITFVNPYVKNKNKNNSQIAIELKKYMSKNNNFGINDRQKIEELIKEKDDIIKCRVQIYQNNSIIKDYISYKIFDSNNIGGKLSRLISSGQYYDLNFNMKYDLNLYNKYLYDYKYPKNMFSVVFPTINEAKKHTSSFMNTLSQKYTNQLYICYSRSFMTIDNQVLTTKVSEPYALNVVSGNNYFQTINLKPEIEERKYNNISKHFPLKYTTIYLYKMNKTNNTFSFLSNLTLFKNTLNLKNGANAMFKNNNIEYPDLNSVENNNKNTYNLVLVKEYQISDNAKLSIPWMDIQKVL